MVFPRRRRNISLLQRKSRREGIIHLKGFVLQHDIYPRGSWWGTSRVMLLYSGQDVVKIKDGKRISICFHENGYRSLPSYYSVLSHQTSSELPCREYISEVLKYWSSCFWVDMTTVVRKRGFEELSGVKRDPEFYRTWLSFWLLMLLLMMMMMMMSRVSFS